MALSTRSFPARILFGQPFTFEVHHSLDECCARIVRCEGCGDDLEIRGAIRSRKANRADFCFEMLSVDDDSAMPLAQASITGALISTGTQTRVIGHAAIGRFVRVFLLAFAIVWAPLWMKLALQAKSLPFAGVALVIIPILFLALYTMDHSAQRLYMTLRDLLTD